MENKKIGAIALLIAITLSAFGLVYAHWSDMVTIDGVIEMGSLTLSWDWVEPPLCYEFWMDENGQLQPGEFEGKLVGECTAEFVDEIYDIHSDKYGYKKLIISVTNAYPQYYVFTTAKLHNIGTIPIFVYGFEITGEKKDSAGNVVYDLLWYDPDGDWAGELWEDVDGDGTVDPAVDILVINLLIQNAQWPLQIDPCNKEKIEVDMDFKQEAEECHHYSIYITVLGVQWNKLDEVYP
ncbi:MAG: hypothetical protein OEZ29_06810 [Candidatus Bathyarchaeota archaeon]|nr:hypothetical protein [Candidatus Bathyarchaeota archaeon]